MRAPLGDFLAALFYATPSLGDAVTAEHEHSGGVERGVEAVEDSGGDGAAHEEEDKESGEALVVLKEARAAVAVERDEDEVMGHRKRSKVNISSESNSDNDCSLSSDNHDGDVHLSNHDESSDNHDQHFEENDPLLHLTKEEHMKKLKIKLGKRPFTDDHKKKRHKVESDSIIDDALLEIHNDLVLHSLKMKLSMLGEQSKNKRKTFEKDNQQGFFIYNDLMKHPSKTNFGMVQKSFSGASLARPIEICDMLFFPILHLRHWFLFVVDLKDESFVFIDSLFEEEEDYQYNARCRLISKFSIVWRKFVPEHPINFASFKIIYPPRPRQTNRLDCGIFTLKFMEIWRPRVLLTNQFSQKDIPNIRIQYVNKLFFHPCNIVLNSTTKKLVTDYYAKG
uniref:OSJNBa0088A01.15 protein n=1 Tax=Oryza sativa subsp. japonica TaxID=39947 RepID=Q7XUD1_ORYSJ|nr:OSJNBa0088A01.15 [Oryza sativa Japonica Group]